MSDSNDSNTTVILSTGSQPRYAGGSQNALPLGTMLGEFEIIDLVGEGGFGIVYLAQDHSLDRKVAIKEYMPSALASRGENSFVSVRSEKQRETFAIGLRSFVNEARILARYDHPALIKVYRFWEGNGTAYMAMPLLVGKNMKDVLAERTTPPDEAWIRKILSPVMDALELIHKDQIYHRDIAPDNIMLLEHDRPVLLDFGAARRVISDMTQALTVILKPGYAPIEQYAEMPGMKQGPWTDIYALAAVVYYSILNVKPPPSVGRMMQDSYEALMTSPAAQNYSARFLDGIDRCLRVKAEDRPQTIEEMREIIGFNHGSAAPHAAPARPAAPPAPAAAKAPAAKPSGRTTTEPMRVDPDDAPIRPSSSGSKLAPALIGLLLVGAAAGGGYYYYTHMQAAVPAAAPTTAAAKPAAASAPLAAAEAKRYNTLPEAIAGAQERSDAAQSIKLDAPASLAFGEKLKLTLSGAKANSFIYAFAWDEAHDKVYRLLPTAKTQDNLLKADGTLSLQGVEAKAPAGDLRVFVLSSEKPRSAIDKPFATDGDLLVADRKALEAALADKGLAGLLGDPQCAAGQACADKFAMSVTTARTAEPPKPEVKPEPKPEAKPEAKPAAKPAAPKPKESKADAEREYMKKLNKDLDNLLGK